MKRRNLSKHGSQSLKLSFSLFNTISLTPSPILFFPSIFLSHFLLFSVFQYLNPSIFQPPFSHCFSSSFLSPCPSPFLLIPASLVSYRRTFLQISPSPVCLWFPVKPHRVNCKNTHVSSQVCKTTTTYTTDTITLYSMTE